MAALLLPVDEATQPATAAAPDEPPGADPSQKLSDDDRASYELLDLNHDWEDHLSDDEHIVSIDELVQQLVAAEDASTGINCLDQITRSHYSIVGCDTWHQLLHLLPVLLSSAAATVVPYSSITAHHSKPDNSSKAPADAPGGSRTAVTSLATAAEQLLLQKLAPEVLDCSPEPLAELLIAFFSAYCSRCRTTGHAAGHADGSTQQTPHSAVARINKDSEANALVANAHHHQLLEGSGMSSSNTANPNPKQYITLPASAVQLITVGLHKIARQWHFLGDNLSAQLSAAVVSLLLEPLQLLLMLHAGCSRAAGAGQQLSQPTAHQQVTDPLKQTQQQTQHGSPMGVAAPGFIASSDYSKQQQQHNDVQKCCCLAEQVLLADPSVGWLHRMNASSVSGRPLRRAMANAALMQQLLLWLAQTPSSSTKLATSEADDLQMQQLVTNAQDVAADAGNASDMQHSSSNQMQVTQQQMQHCSCIAEQLVATLVETRAGRKLLTDPDCVRKREACTGGGDGGHNMQTPGSEQRSGGGVLAVAVPHLQRLAEHVHQQGPDNPTDATAAAVVEAAVRALEAMQQQQQEEHDH